MSYRADYRLQFHGLLSRCKDRPGSSLLHRTTHSCRVVIRVIIATLRRPWNVLLNSTGYASSVDTPSLVTVDPAHSEATSLLESGTKLLEEGDCPPI